MNSAAYTSKNREIKVDLNDPSECRHGRGVWVEGPQGELVHHTFCSLPENRRYLKNWQDGWLPTELYLDQKMRVKRSKCEFYASNPIQRRAKIEAKSGPRERFGDLMDRGCARVRF